MASPFLLGRTFRRWPHDTYGVADGQRVRATERGEFRRWGVEPSHRSWRTSTRYLAVRVWRRQVTWTATWLPPRGSTATVEGYGNPHYRWVAGRDTTGTPPRRVRDAFVRTPGDGHEVRPTDTTRCSSSALAHLRAAEGCRTTWSHSSPAASPDANPARLLPGCLQQPLGQSGPNEPHVCLIRRTR